MNTHRLYFNFTWAFLVLVWGTDAATLLSNLSDATFAGYSKKVRPFCVPNERVNVTLDVALRQVFDLDEPNQLLKLSLWIRMNWGDCRLTWNPDDYDGIDNFVTEAKDIWTPDMALYDSTQQDFAQLDGARVQITSNGSVQFNFPTTTEVRCKVDVTYFPFDRQTCPLKFGLWLHSGAEVDVRSKATTGDLSSADENVEWELLGLPNERHEIKYSCCPELYPDTTFYVKLKRKSRFYVMQLILPYIVTSTIGLLAYALPSESGEKVSLGVTVLLALTVFMLILGDTLPPSSETTPLIAVYFDISIFLVCFSCLMSVLVLHFFFKPNTPVPSWVRTVFLKYLAKILMVEATRLPGHATYERSEKKVVRRTTVRLSRFMEKLTPTVHGNNRAQVSPALPPLRDRRTTNDRVTPNQGNVNHVHGDEALDHTPDPEYADLPKETRNDETVVTEWQILANVLDRLGLFVHSVSLVLSSFIVLITLEKS
ncbi:hypothetical protein ScPMuIL_018685 [Solemya velum]